MKSNNFMKYNYGRIRVEEIGNISEKAFRDLIQKDVIRKEDLEILHMISEYEVMNRYNIERAIRLNKQIPDSLKLKSYKKRLQFYTEIRLLNRFYIEYEQGSDNDTALHSPYIYKLSRGAYTLICDHFGIKKSKYFSELVSLESTIMRLSYNQAVISMLECNDKKIGNDNALKKHVKNYSKGLIRIRNSFSCQLANEHYSILVEVVRRKIDKYLDQKIQLLANAANAYTKKKSKKVIIILVCEDDLHVEEVTAQIIGDEKQLSTPIHFTTDSRTCDGALLDGLLRCSYQSETRKIFELRQISLG